MTVRPLLILLASLLVPSVAQADPFVTTSKHVPDQLLLKLPTVADAEAAYDLLRRLSSTVGTPLQLKRQSVMSWWVVDNAGSPLETAELDALAVRLAAQTLST